ncbi:MAG: DUF4347 domain-containing protein [Verrucomicrobiota bacterium]
MATVWAYRVGAWQQKGETGWSNTMQMRGLSDLADSMERAKLRGMVSHLAIVAHGDQPGVVQLDRILMSSNVSSFLADFANLKPYLTGDGMLTFYSCIAGKDQPGSRLLTEVSRILPGCTVVGFEVFGLIGPSGLSNAPGSMIGTDTPLLQLAMKPRSQLGRLDPWCRFAKRARDGKVIHLPVLEQNGRFNKKCANPSCPGHADPGHSCKGW